MVAAIGGIWLAMFFRNLGARALVPATIPISRKRWHMADTNHSHTGSIPVEGDGISYRGIIWFVAVLAITRSGHRA